MDQNLQAQLNSSALKQSFNKIPSDYFIVLWDFKLRFQKPWFFLEEKDIDVLYVNINERYKSRNVLPFATRRDNDDVACFDLDKNNIIIIHDFASPGWEVRNQYDTIWDWLHRVVEDMRFF
jgi:hypothetical protein